MFDNTTNDDGRERDSVLVSLRRLRKIEDRRITTEQEAAEQRQRQRRERREAAEAADREAAATARREEEARELRRRKQVVAEQREARLRLAEAERRARVEAEMRLEHEQLAREFRVCPPKPRSLLPPALAAIVILLMGATLLGMAWHQELEAADRRQALIARLEKQNDRWTRELKQARERLVIREQSISALKAQLQTLESTSAGRREGAVPVKIRGRGTGRKTGGKMKKGGKDRTIRFNCKDPEDPLCGIEPDDRRVR